MAVKGSLAPDAEESHRVSATNEAARGRSWPRRERLALLATLYTTLWAGAALLPIVPTDLDAFFLPSARVVLARHPFLIYSVRYLGVYPNANGPLSILPLALVAAIAQHLGWLSNVYLRRMLVMAAFSLFALLMSREALLAVERFVARPLTSRQRLLVLAMFALSPELWHAVLLYGHIELPILLALVLAAVRMLARRRVLVAGVLLGLALLTRSMAVLYLMPLALLLLWHRRWHDCAWLLGMAGIVAVLGFLPFWLADRTDVLYSLVTFRPSLPVGGGSFWELFSGTPLFGFGQTHDSLVALALALLLSIVVLWMRPDIGAASREVYALLALCSLCFPLAIKTVWPYYFLDVFVLFGVYWLTGLGRAQRARAGVTWRLWWLGLLPPLAVIGVALLGEYGVSSAGYGYWSPTATALMTAATATLALGVGVWIRLARTALSERQALSG